MGVKKIYQDCTDNMLILRYSEMNCDVCVDSLISKLNLYMDSVGIENIALFTTSQNKGYIRRFKKVNKIKFDIYDIGLKLDSVLTDIGVPYFFVLSRNRRVNNMFVPQSEYIDLTDKYLHSILYEILDEFMIIIAVSLKDATYCLYRRIFNSDTGKT